MPIKIQNQVRGAAPVEQAPVVSFYAKQKGEATCIFASRDNGRKVYRIAQINPDGVLHLRPGNQGSGLDTDGRGFVEVEYDEIDAAGIDDGDELDYDDPDE